MRTALIGYSGFVGSNISNQYAFDDQYNSKNIENFAGQEYDLVVSAANRAEMWRINQEPEKDLADIKAYIANIKKAKIKKLVLISTTGVYRNPVGVDEATLIDTKGLLPYGANRYYLENFCKDNLDTLIVRLPGLFGPGLKKNVIFDFLHDNNIDRIHYAGIYQYYNLKKIWKDIAVALDHRLSLVNFATEPVRTDELAKECFNVDFTNVPEGIQPANFDVHTKYAKLYGGRGGYIYSKQQELADIKAFVERQS